jgi:hypothetical protein
MKVHKFLNLYYQRLITAVSHKNEKEHNLSHWEAERLALSKRK